MWPLVSAVVSWSLSRGLSVKTRDAAAEQRLSAVEARQTKRIFSPLFFYLQGVSGLLPHDATSSHWVCSRSHKASIYISKNSTCAEWSFAISSWASSTLQAAFIHFGCGSSFLVSFFSCHLSESNPKRQYNQWKYLDTQVLDIIVLWNQSCGRYWNPGGKHFIWSCFIPCFSFLGFCHLPDLCSDIDTARVAL